MKAYHNEELGCIAYGPTGCNQKWFIDGKSIVDRQYVTDRIIALREHVVQFHDESRTAKTSSIRRDYRRNVQKILLAIPLWERMLRS